MTGTIHSVLEELLRSAKDEKDKGDRFERLVGAYLRTDPVWADRFSDVWLWMQWPDRQGKPDTGIDLVARERETGDLTAVQCKFFSPDHTLQKQDIDSFFTASGKEPFRSRLIVSTNDNWSKHAEDALKDQQIPVTRLRFQDLDESSVDWSQFSITAPDDLRLKGPKELRPHQIDALSWAAPATTGGSTITGYTVTATPGGHTCTTSALTCTVTGLTNGVAYIFAVRATNIVGTGIASAASASIIVGTPSAPRTLAVTFPAAGTAKVTWVAPATLGSSAVSAYQVRWSSNGGVTWSAWVSTKLVLSTTPTALAKAHAYEIQVRAINTSGAGIDASKTFTQTL
ncbi:MAG: fibronectin type III domain-containing protein [Actinomycetes bacterium]